jgi:hypothetical protein
MHQTALNSFPLNGNGIFERSLSIASMFFVAKPSASFEAVMLLSLPSPHPKDINKVD